MKKTGLGKGFDELFPKDFDGSLLLDKNERIQKLSVNSVHANTQQPRKHFDEQALNELRGSIEQYGVLQPLIVVPKSSEEGEYIVVAGERRLRAAIAAGLSKVPCIVREREKLEQLEVSLIENVQRVDLTPLEQAVSIERLHQEFGLHYNEIAKKLGKAPTTITNIVRLLQLPEKARASLEIGVISEGHARAILALRDYPSEQNNLLELIAKNGWSVRQAEQYVTSIKQGKKSSRARSRVSSETKATKALSKKLGTKVTLRRTAKGGCIEIHFTDDKRLSELEQILQEL